MSDLMPGDKAKLVNALDNLMADETAELGLFSIEITVSKSPKLGVKCGQIVIFRRNASDLVLEGYDRIDTTKYTQEQMEEIRTNAAKYTDYLVHGPELFKETDGRWLPWAIERVLELWGRFPGKITLRCPMFQVEESVSSATVSRSSSEEGTPLFHDTIMRINALMDAGFEYDPWTRKIRRGRIGADMAKR